MNTPIRCLIIDKEPIARSILRKYIDEVNYLTLKKECSTEREAWDYLQGDEEVDLCFVNLDLNANSGGSLLNWANKEPKIIVTTTQTRNQNNGFGQDNDGLLFKPVSFDRFYRAVNKVTGIDNSLPNKNSNMLDYVILESGKKKYNVPVYSILYIEGMSNYVKVITTDKTLIIYQRLRDLENQLAPFNFKRIHKSFIVPMEKIDTYSSKYVYIQQSTIPIGYSYKKLVDESLKMYVLK